MENSHYAQFHTSAELETAFDRVFGGRLGFCGFERIGARKWVQETGCGFKYLFHLHPQSNGYAYLPCGAISIDFVPRFVAGELRIQPKPKNVAVHYSFGKAVRWDWMIDKNRENFGVKVERIAGESVPEITAWFQRFKSLNNIAEALDSEKAKSRAVEFYCYPLTVIAYAFVLARIRRFDDARSELAKAIESNYWDNDLQPELQRLLEAEIQRTNIG